MTTLETAALASGGWAIAGLAVSVTRAWRRRTPAARAAPAGSAWRGVVYALGPGMGPRAKESASDHPVVYVIGLTYHAAIFAALLALALLSLHVAVPAPLAAAAIALPGTGSIAGLALLARRARSPLLRAISSADDYASNLIVDGWLLAAALALARGESTVLLLAASIVLGVYAPLGKIRHCVFFLLARARYGARLGRRGIVAAARPAVSR